MGVIEMKKQDVIDPTSSLYQEGYKAGLDINSKLMQDAMYLLAVWERGAEADDYVMDLWHLRQKFDVYAKSQNVNTSDKRVYASGISATSDKSEILATADKTWVGLTDEEIEKIVDMNTSDDGGFDLFCDGHSIADAVIDKLQELNK
jgi:hypothetical protein